MSEFIVVCDMPGCDFTTASEDEAAVDLAAQAHAENVHGAERVVLR